MVEPTSLDCPINSEEESALGDFIADNTLKSPIDYVFNQKHKEKILKVLESLTPREQLVIILRHGLKDGKYRTLEEVGQLFNVTRERIRQIESKALRKLRHPSRAKNLID